MTQRLLLIGGMLSLLLAIGFQPSMAQDNIQPYDGLNILFAVDVSGSMYERVNFSNHDEVDRSPRYLMEYLRTDDITRREDFESQPTDPSNIRFEAIDFMFEWLQNFALTQNTSNRQLDVNMRIATFDQNAQFVTPWVNLGTGDSLTYTPPTGNNLPAHSDFANLYNTLKTSGEAPPQGNNKNILFIITDSLPCNPETIEASCALPSAITNQINGLNAQGLSGFTQYLYIIPPTDGSANLTEQVQNVYSDFDDNWEEELRTLPQYLPLENLPTTLFNALIMEIGTAWGIGSTDVFTELHLNPVKQTFEVPPYLTSMEVLAFLPDGDTAGLPTFQQGEDTMTYSTIDTKADGVLNRLRFDHPRPGNWEIITQATSFNTWATYFPARASLSFRSDSGTIYSPFEIQYQILDEAGDPLPVQESYPLNFNISLVGPSGNFDITEFEPAGTAYIARFATLDAGSYAVSGTVSADQTWVSMGDSNKSFLVPPQDDTISIETVTWVPQFGSEEQQAAIQEGVLSMSRRDEVEVSLYLRQGTKEIPIPDNATATLSFEPTPNAADACPTPNEVNMTPAQPTRLASTIRFPEGGECSVSLEITLADDEFLPIETADTVIYRKQVIGTAEVSTTSRVNVVVPSDESEPMPFYTVNEENELTSLSLEMADYVGSPQVGKDGSLLSWQRDETTIRLLIQNEDGNPVDPQYEGFQTAALTEEDVTTEQDVIVTDAPIPFQVRITRTTSDQNVADAKGIHIVKSAQIGYYLLNIRNLDPGDYLVEIILNTDEPPLQSDFEYASALREGIRPGAQPTFRASLHVSENQTVILLNQLLMGIGAVAGIFLVYRVGRVWRTKRAPLNGTIGIYKRIGDKPSTPLEMVFEESLPAKISYEIPPANLPQYPLAVDRMMVTTRASRQISRDRGIWVTLVLDGHELPPKYLESGQLSEEGAFYIDPHDNTHYYLIKDKEE